MGNKRYLVLDIETRTDWQLVRDVFRAENTATTEDLRTQVSEKYSSGFLPPAYHVPICIALIDVDSKTFKVHNATVLENADEKLLLQQFWKLAKQRKGKNITTSFVTFNGRGFDLPCLFLRSLKHRVSVATYERNRYALEDSHDICDDLADFGAASRHSLDIIAKLLGLPGKSKIKGDQVEDLHQRGEIKAIKDYCMDDALTTYLIWLTIKFVRGTLDEAKYREAFDSAAGLVKSCRSVTELFFNNFPPAVAPPSGAESTQ